MYSFRRRLSLEVWGDALQVGNCALSVEKIMNGTAILHIENAQAPLTMWLNQDRVTEDSSKFGNMWISLLSESDVLEIVEGQFAQDVCGIDVNLIRITCHEVDGLGVEVTIESSVEFAGEELVQSASENHQLRLIAA